MGTHTPAVRSPSRNAAARLLLWAVLLPTLLSGTVQAAPPALPGPIPAEVLEVVDGIMTGAVVEPILDKDSKLEALLAYAGERHVPTAETMAVGDGANDLPMLLSAGLGVAFHAKPTVAAQARARVDHGDLTALLFAQGYRIGEFVEG